MRLGLVIGVALAVQGCTTSTSNTGGGVGFGQYDSYQEQQEALAQQRQVETINPGLRISEEESGSTTSSLQGLLASLAPAPQPDPEPIEAPEPQPQPTPEPVQTTSLSSDNGSSNPDISDEQDFEAVSSRESIESDRERLEAQRESYQVIQPTDLPRRPGSSEPSIVEFALSTTNKVGEALYSRSTFLAASRFARNCARYPSPDLAQLAFLEAGGPEQDRMGLDPDGDGFACYWTPEPYRAARAGN